MGLYAARSQSRPLTRLRITNGKPPTINYFRHYPLVPASQTFLLLSANDGKSFGSSYSNLEKSLLLNANYSIVNASTPIVQTQRSLYRRLDTHFTCLLARHERLTPCDKHWASFGESQPPEISRDILRTNSARQPREMSEFVDLTISDSDRGGRFLRMFTVIVL